MALEKKQVLFGYDSDLLTGTMFLKFKNQIVEDGKVIQETLHRETITSEKYDELKKLKFADVVLLAKAEALSKLSIEVKEKSALLDTEKAEKQALKAERDTLKAERDALKAEKKAVIK